jgi:hypothetical protein
MNTLVPLFTAPAFVTPVPIFLVPALVTLAPILVGLGVSRFGGRWAHAVVLAVIVGISLALGVATFSQHSSEVSASRALGGSVIAGALGGLLPLTAYFELGYRVRSRIVLIVCWLVSVVPFYYYAIVLVLLVAAQTNCTPDQYECPV